MDTYNTTVLTAALLEMLGHYLITPFFFGLLSEAMEQH